jgi:hypothetical protein
MPSLETLKPTDRFGCPMCKRQGLSVHIEGIMKGSLRPHKAGHAGRENVGGTCPGAGFSPFRPAFPQYVRMFGLADAIADVRHVHVKPDWEPESMQPGDLQKFVLDAWPQADRFEMAPLTGVRGMTFTLGTRRWRFAAPDGFLSPEFTSRADASDALYEHLKEN